MAPIPASEPTSFDILQNRIAIAVAKRERLIKSWTSSSARPRAPEKTQEQLEAEDAELYRQAPPHLGLGAPIPKEYENGILTRKDIKGTEKLRGLLLGKKGLVGSTPRPRREEAKLKAKEESSDEEEGRSALGKVKKGGNGAKPSSAVKPKVAEELIQEEAFADKKTDQKRKAPLVQYDSSEDGRSSTASAKKQKLASLKSGSPPIRAGKATSQKSVSPAAQPRPVITNEQPKTSNATSALLSVTTTATQPSPKPTKAAKNDSDSEPSDLEVSIPTALVSAPQPALPTTSISTFTASSTSSPKPDDLGAEAESKRAKNRLSKQKKKDRKKLLQALSAHSDAGKDKGARKNGDPQSPVVVAKKKFKDRMLDAGGD